jgi:hypothetical protein
MAPTQGSRQNSNADRLYHCSELKVNSEEWSAYFNYD